MDSDSFYSDSKGANMTGRIREDYINENNWENYPNFYSFITLKQSEYSIEELSEYSGLPYIDEIVDQRKKEELLKLWLKP